MYYSLNINKEEIHWVGLEVHATRPGPSAPGALSCSQHLGCPWTDAIDHHPPIGPYQLSCTVFCCGVVLSPVSAQDVFIILGLVLQLGSSGDQAAPPGHRTKESLVVTRLCFAVKEKHVLDQTRHSLDDFAGKVLARGPVLVAPCP